MPVQVEPPRMPLPGLVAFASANAAFLAAGVLLSFASSFGQTFFVSVFAGEIMAAFALTDGGWGLTYTLGTTIAAAATIWMGGLADRFRIRQLAIAAGLLLASACALMAVAWSPPALLAAIVLLRLSGLGMMAQLSAVAMARWFVASRGRALAVASMGFALGQAVLPVTFAAALEVVPWRGLWLVAAAVVLVLLVPILRLLRSERTPRSLAADAPSPGMGGRQWRRADALRHPLFWGMLPLLLAPSAFVTALFFHQVHLTQAKGWDLVGYVALLPVFTAATVAATFASGALLDRIGTARPMVLLALPYAAAFAVMGAVETLGGAAVAFAFLGIGAGMQATVPAAFWAEFYGTRHLGAIKAMAVSVMVLGTAIGPGLTGLLIDAGRPLPAQMPALAGSFLAAAALAGLAIARTRRGLAAA